TLMLTLSHPPLSENPAWSKLKTHLEAYIESTEDLNLYSEKGFDRIKLVNEDLNSVALTLQEERRQIYDRVAALQQKARRSIQLWTTFALLMGAAVTVGTVWEVQRRFRE